MCGRYNRLECTLNNFGCISSSGLSPSLSCPLIAKANRFWFDNSMIVIRLAEIGKISQKSAKNEKKLSNPRKFLLTLSLWDAHNRFIGWIALPTAWLHEPYIDTSLASLTIIQFLLIATNNIGSTWSLQPIPLFERSADLLMKAYEIVAVKCHVFSRRLSWE